MVCLTNFEQRAVGKFPLNGTKSFFGLEPRTSPLNLG